VRPARTPELVQAGIPPLPRIHHGEASTAPLVWAGRLTSDKGVGEFLDVVRASDHAGRIHGSGPLEQEMRAISPAIVEWAGWQAPETLWSDASIYLSTSHREAYGRCAVEAASTGLPVILGDQVGVAPQLYTDPDLFARFVLPVGDTDAWAAAVEELLDDPDLRHRVSDHVHANAVAMSIEASVSSAHERLETLRSNS
jgi:glycosyltransferase involved in cell wall biosynthesis